MKSIHLYFTAMLNPGLAAIVRMVLRTAPNFTNKLIKILTCMNNYIPIFIWYILTHPCPNVIVNGMALFHMDNYLFLS